MKTKILLAALAGALVMPVPLVSQADVMGGTDFTIYGRVIAGVNRADTDKDMEDAVWDLGATGRGGSGQQQSRIGFKADRDIGGMTVGFKMEQGLNSGGDAGFNTRHRYVYMRGDFGTLTIGNQTNPYLMGANWAREWYLGGHTVGSFREEGLGYAWSNGTFNLNVLLTGDDVGTANTAGGETAAQVRQGDTDTAGGRVTDETIDRTIIGASYDFGVVKVGFGYNKDNTESDHDRTVIGVGGNVSAFEYYVGYQKLDDATKDGKKDRDGWGAFLGYKLSDADKVYFEYESQGTDLAPAMDLNSRDGYSNERTNTVLGYSHEFGGSTRFIAEYRIRDFEGSDEKPTQLALTVMVSF